MDPVRLYAVIMAGGSGTRFWPLSRAGRPKQLLGVCRPEPMIRTTVDRVRPLVPPERILVVTAGSHAQAVRSLLPDLPPDNILVEPVGRNTAPCIGLAALVVRRRDPDGVMLVLPADHVIEKPAAFLNLARAGAGLAASREALVTLGVVPSYPETGFGYIETGADAFEADGVRVLAVRRFHEKPDLDRARAYLASGRHFWNSGIFLWPARTILEWMARLLTELHGRLQTLVPSIDEPDFQTALDRTYPDLPAVSIDYGIMEKADGVLVIPADIGWNDVGSWSAAARYWPRVEGNALQGTGLFIDAEDCAVYSPDKLVALIGVRDLVVVETPDALLVCHKDRDQDVRDLVEALKKKGRNDLV
ncbi:MAG: NTP transferase domain-containing protein [Proteobacteria bacterium]|nr:NTP transferase domain-containing protein [Pseudomonadota bacterium]